MIVDFKGNDISDYCSHDVEVTEELYQIEQKRLKKAARIDKICTIIRLLLMCILFYLAYFVLFP